MGSTDCETHEHCSRCFTRSCKSEECPLEYCHQRCGALLHACKHSDHINVCPNARLACINAYFGCPVYLHRSRMANHLAGCPASVVFCSMEWNRWPLYSPERKVRVPFVQQNFHAKYGQLDVALALRDQRLLSASLKAPKALRASLRNPLTRCFPAVPIDHWEDEENTQDYTPSRSSSSEDPLAPWVIRQAPPGLQASIKAKICEADHKNLDTKETSVTETLSSSCTSCKTPPPLPDYFDLSLDLNVEVIPQYVTKPKSMYTFMCALNLRRDEYASHYKNVHSDIHGGLSGWIEHRCPMSQAGCTFHRRRFEPQNATLVFSETVGSYGIKPVMPELPSEVSDISLETFPGDENLTCTQDYLSSLPIELLHNILQFLDGFSLSHLSLVSKYLRQACSEMLKTHGLVILAWQRSENRWNPSHKRWMFSAATHDIKKWRITDYASPLTSEYSNSGSCSNILQDKLHMSQHLATCQHYTKPLMGNNPVKVLVGVDDLSEVTLSKLSAMSLS